MVQKLDAKTLTERRARVLDAARWCFLNFGFARTTLEDIARRAGISRTLLYRIFKDKEDIFVQVFDEWILSRVDAALRAGAQPGAPRQRLARVCQALVLDSWSEMADAPMADEFHDVYERLRPKVAWAHREKSLECVDRVLEDPAVSLVFLLALEGLFVDRPDKDTLIQRVRVLVNHFAPA